MNEVTRTEKPDPREKAEQIAEAITTMAEELTALRQRQDDTTAQLKTLSADVREAKASAAETRRAFEPESLNKMIAHHTRGATEPYLHRVAEHALEASAEGGARAARQAVEGIGEELNAKASEVLKKYEKAAGEARREAWGWFGGFWVWLASMLLLGALLGVLATLLIGGLNVAKEFGKYPGVYCSSAGGERGTSQDGNEYCVFWLDN